MLITVLLTIIDYGAIMCLMIQVDNFEQPSDIPERFSAFVDAQDARRYEAECGSRARLFPFSRRRDGTIADPEIFYAAEKGYAVVRYRAERRIGLFSLQFRTFDTDKDHSTKLYTEYTLARQRDGLVTAREVNGPPDTKIYEGNELVLTRQEPDTPQALATSLGRTAFKRGALETENSIPPEQFFGVVGEEEFDELSQFLIDRKLK